jgi:hypothetical protein
MVVGGQWGGFVNTVASFAVDFVWDQPVAQGCREGSGRNFAHNGLHIKTTEIATICHQNILGFIWSYIHYLCMIYLFPKWPQLIGNLD